MRKPIIRAIFVDFGNVCATYDFGRFFRAFHAQTAVPFERLDRVLRDDTTQGYSPLFAAFERGELSPLQFFVALTNLLGCRSRIDYHTFARMWTDVFFEENAELDRLLSRLPQKKYLLSNTNKLVYERYIVPSAIVGRHFPDPKSRILSYEVGAIKPDPFIYRVALKRAGVSANEALFIDDLPENIAAWEMFGGHGIVYSAKTDPIDALKQELKKFGMLS